MSEEVAKPPSGEQKTQCDVLENLSDRVKELLLLQPLNPFAKLRFSVVTDKEKSHGN